MYKWVTRGFVQDWCLAIAKLANTTQWENNGGRKLKALERGREKGWSRESQSGKEGMKKGRIRERDRKWRNS